MLFAQLPLKLRRSAPFALPSKYVENDDDDDKDDEEDEEAENLVAADEAKAQGLAACTEFVFKLFPDAKVGNMIITCKQTITSRVSCLYSYSTFCFFKIRQNMYLRTSKIM